MIKPIYLCKLLKNSKKPIIKGLFPGEIPYTVWQVNHNEKKGATKNTVAAHIYRNFGTHGSTPEPFGMSLSWSKGLRKQTAVRGRTWARWATQLWSVLMLFWKWWNFHPSYPIISLNPPPFKSSNKELMLRFLWWFHDLNVPFKEKGRNMFPSQTSPKGWIFPWKKSPSSHSSK